MACLLFSCQVSLPHLLAPWSSLFSLADFKPWSFQEQPSFSCYSSQPSYGLLSFSCSFLPSDSGINYYIIKQSIYHICNHDYAGVSYGTYLVHFCYDLQLPSSPSSLSTPWLKSMWWVAHWERLGIYSTLILPFDFSSLVSESLWRVACQNQVPRSRITRATDGALFLTTSSSHACWGEATIYKTESLGH